MHGLAHNLEDASNLIDIVSKLEAKAKTDSKEDAKFQNQIDQVVNVLSANKDMINHMVANTADNEKPKRVLVDKLIQTNRHRKTTTTVIPKILDAYAADETDDDNFTGFEDEQRSSATGNENSTVLLGLMRISDDDFVLLPYSSAASSLVDCSSFLRLLTSVSNLLIIASLTILYRHFQHPA